MANKMSRSGSLIADIQYCGHFRGNFEVAAMSKSSIGIPALHIELHDGSHLANELLVKDLKVSDGWLHQFEGQQGLLFRKAIGEAT